MVITYDGASHTASLLAGKRISICGAGIAGLGFVVSLSKQWPLDSDLMPTISVYERDSYADRLGREGYSLSLRTDSGSGGIQALDKMGLYEDALAASIGHEGSDGGAFVLWGENWKDYIVACSEPVGPKKLTGLRIRRNALQRVLAEGATKAGADIHWDMQVTDISRLEDERIRVHFKDDTVHVCDMLIAADGSRSVVRNQVKPGFGLDFAGVSMISATGKFDRTDQVPSPMNKFWGMIVGGNAKGVGLFCSPVDDCSALYSFSQYRKEPRPPQRHPIPQGDLDELMRDAESYSKDFPTQIQELVQHTDPTSLMIVNAMDRPAFSHNLSKEGPIVWIGDANHAVSPFAGNGANLALMDAWDLATCLCDAQSFADAVQQYDKASMPRALATLKQSRQTIDVALATGWKLVFYRCLFSIIGFFIRLRGSKKP